jgi:hypothetical protein
MYREWTRDFRCCKRDCKRAIHHLKKGNLIKWYEFKTQSIKSYARSMLNGVSNSSKLHQLFNNETNVTIPNDLATMERRNGSISNYDIIFMTPRIADIIVDVQQEEDRIENWRILNIYKTRQVTGKQFQKMFLEKFRKDLNKMPPCFEMGKTSGVRPLSPLSAEVAMPWKDLGQQLTLEYLSIGKDADGISYSKKELRMVMDTVVDRDSPPYRFLIPCAQNQASWDAVVVLYVEEEGKRAVHVIFLQTTMKPNREIYAKGLNQLRDAIPAEWKCEGLGVHYHYVLVLLTKDILLEQIPKWRHVLVSMKEGKDPEWHPDNLRQYVMFIQRKQLPEPLSKDWK